MPNIKSAKKRVSVIAHKTAANRMAKSNLKTVIKKVTVSTAQGDKAAANSAFLEAQKAIDKAAARGLIHKNTAARRKARLHRETQGIQ